jgi:hypothetical protein
VIAWTRAAILLATLAVGCASPEATRTRGQGSGADVRNVREVVRMHDGADPYWRTPRVDGIGGPPLEPGRQAARRSR